MAALTNPKHRYDCRARALDSAIKRLNGWLEDDTLLFWAYVLFLIGCAVAILHGIAHYLFLWIVIPLVFLRAVVLEASRSPLELSFGAKVSLSRVLKGGRTVSVIGSAACLYLSFGAKLSLSRFLRIGTTVSVIWSAAGLYLLMLILSSALPQPTVSIKKLTEVSVNSFEILAFLFVTAILVVSSKGFLRTCLTVVSIAAAAIALVAIIVFVATRPFDYLFYFRLGHWPKGQGPSVASLAINSGIFLVASIAIFLEDTRSLWHRLPLAASALTLMSALVLTQSRSVCLAALAGIAATIHWSSRSIRRAAVAVPAVLILALILITTVPGVSEIILWRGDSRRLEIWSHYINTSWDQPWLGSGMMRNIFETMDGAVIPHPHNLILSAQVRGGVLATGAMIVMLLGGLYYSAEYAKLTGQRAPLGIMVTLVVAGIFDYQILIRSFPDWQTLFFWFPVGICIGAEHFVRARRNGESRAIA